MHSISKFALDIFGFIRASYADTSISQLHLWSAPEFRIAAYAASMSARVSTFPNWSMAVEDACESWPVEQQLMECWCHSRGSRQLKRSYTDGSDQLQAPLLSDEEPDSNYANGDIDENRPSTA